MSMGAAYVSVAGEYDAAVALVVVLVVESDSFVMDNADVAY